MWPKFFPRGLCSFLLLLFTAGVSKRVWRMRDDVCCAVFDSVASKGDRHMSICCVHRGPKSWPRTLYTCSAHAIETLYPLACQEPHLSKQGTGLSCPGCSSLGWGAGECLGPVPEPGAVLTRLGTARVLCTEGWKMVFSWTGRKSAALPAAW